MSLRSILLLWRHPPYGSARAQDTLDVALAFGALGRAPTVLFLGDGCWCLQSGQNSSAVKARSIDKMLQAFDLYGVDQVFASASALAQRGLAPGNLALAVQALDDAALATLLARHDTVISL